MEVTFETSYFDSRGFPHGTDHDHPLARLLTRSPVYIDVADPQLDPRPGPQPLTTRPNPSLAFPHQQLTQTGPTEFSDVLVGRGALLPGVDVADSCVSVPGARAFSVSADLAAGPAQAFQCSTEFAHVHPAGDGSLHMTLPPLVYDDVIAKGWGEPHPISGTMLVFGPRDRRELEVVWQLVITSYRFAIGYVETDADLELEASDGVMESAS